MRISIALHAALLVVFLGCKQSESSSAPNIAVMSSAPPSLQLKVQGNLSLKHVAASVDGIPNYQPLVLNPETAGFSCPQDDSIQSHRVTIYDHRSIPDPVVLTEGSGSVTDENGSVTGGGFQYYDAETLSKGRSAIQSGLEPLLSFNFEGSCIKKVLLLTYKAEGQSLSVTYSLTDRN